jgi:hypothetical protein
MNTHEIVSIETSRLRGASHPVVTGVHTKDEQASEHRSWTLTSVLTAMNRAERFYTVAPNGRRARVQRYRCAVCRRDHIRTHISDAAIHALENLPARRPALQN